MGNEIKPIDEDAANLLTIQGNENLDALYQDVYLELRDIANKQMQKAWSLGTLSTTVLVNEAYLKLMSLDKEKLQSEAHFFAIAATAMRQIIINYAEQKNAAKRGGDWVQVTYEEPELQSEVDFRTLILVNDALDDIRKIDDKLAQLVELRFFAGMTEVEIAKVFKVSEKTVRRNWQKAKMLLKQGLTPV